MRISPISFSGKNEISAFVDRYKPLSKQEQFIKNYAYRVHNVPIVETSDEAYCSREGEMIVESYLDMLDKIGQSRFAYLVAVDTMNANVMKKGVNRYDEKLSKTILKIAKDTPSVTKFDILANLNVFPKNIVTYG